MRIDDAWVSDDAFNEWSCEVANVMEDVLVERGAMECDAFLCHVLGADGNVCAPECFVRQELRRRGLMSQMSPIYTGTILARIYDVERAHAASFRRVVSGFYGHIGSNRARIAWLRQGCPAMPYDYEADE